jgi:intracellular sulfur oxidation DsrE/DsrF family protein
MLALKGSRSTDVKLGLWITLLMLTTSTVNVAEPQIKNQSNNRSDEPASGWTYPVIRDYGRAWPLPQAADQPQKGRTYKTVFDITKLPQKPNQVVPGLADAARLMNVFGTLGLSPTNLKIVAVFHGDAAYAAMNNDVYRSKFGIDNPNVKLIQELKAADVQLFLCGQAFHDFNFQEKDILPDVKMATAAVVVLVTYQNDGYALMPA